MSLLEASAGAGDLKSGLGESTSAVRAPPCGRRRARPIPDGIAQILADDAVEGLAIAGAVQVTQHVIQGPVLEQL